MSSPRSSEAALVSAPASPPIETGAPALELRGVAKQFVGETDRHSLRGQFVRLGRSRTEATAPRFSLREVSLSVAPGESVAVVGRNGAGKSTLLRLMAGVYWPTRGEIVSRGRVAALLELTAGFHPELTGSENVHLYGSLLGLSRRRIEELYPRIVDFAGIPELMQTPVKHYSTGMGMRLGFAVATAEEPEVLLLDEVLAVGDAGFRDRCLDRIRGFQCDGCAVVFATHDVELAEEMSSRALWMEAGRVRLEGPTSEVVEAYRHSFVLGSGGG